MLVISGIEFTTCFKNMPMQRTFAEKYHCNMFFLIWVNHSFLALKMTFCYRICYFCDNNLYISFFSLCYVCNKIGIPVR